MPNKKQVEQLIDKLASKELSFGCKFKRKSDEAICTHTGKSKAQFIAHYLHPELKEPAPLLISELEIIGHNIMIGDVLEKIYRTGSIFMRTSGRDYRLLRENWDECGFTKSLQEIAKCGYEEVESKYNHGAFDMKPWTIERLKNPEADKLFTFLIDILNNQ